MNNDYAFSLDKLRLTAWLPGKDRNDLHLLIGNERKKVAYFLPQHQLF